MIGETLGHHRVLEKIGAGGMGEVYLAHDEHLLRDVAIKVLPAGALVDENARKRFRKEAQAVSRLSHPNIGIVYDFDTQEGVDFLVMEYIPGQPLSDKLESGPLPEKEVIRLGLQMTEGLAAAHEHGIVHRDLKPANLMITPEGRLKILDFGLAKLLNPVREVAVTEMSTETKGVSGTLPYMAPEQLLGERLDARTDIHAAGVILYEMASGRRPFQANTIPKLTDAILHQAPVALRVLNAKFPPRLDEIVFKCLEKDPEMRYGSAKELAIDLRRVSAPVSSTAKLPRRPQRRRWIWIGAGVLAGVLAVAIVTAILLLVQRGSTRQRLSTGALASTNAEANEYFEKAQLFLSSQYDLPRGRQMLEQALALDPQFTAAQAEYGFTHLLMIDGGWSNDSSWFYKAEENIRRVLQDAPESSHAHSALAAVYTYMGRKELVPVEAEKALSLNPQDWNAYAWLTNYYMLNEDYDRAEAYARQVLDRAPLFFPVRLNLGDLLRMKGDYAGAIRELEKLLDQDPQNIIALRYLARTYTDAGDLPKARSTLERVRQADRQTYRIRLAWAVLHALEGKRAQAIKEMDEEVLKYAAIVVDETPTVAQVYPVLGETTKAMEWLDRAVRNGDERADTFSRDPLLAGIRTQPGFQQILDSIAMRRRQKR